MLFRPAINRSLSRVVLICSPLCLVSFAALAIAQSSDYVVQKWTTADGLPSSNVSGVARSSDGFLWIGTDRGLARFDGTQFNTFTPSNFPTLGSDVFGQILAGTDSQLYMAAGAGMVTLKDGKAQHFAATNGNGRDIVQVVLPVGPDEAWVGTLRGQLLHYNSGAMNKVGADLVSKTTIYGLGKASDGTLWIATDNGLFTLLRGHLSQYRPTQALHVSSFFDLAITDTGTVYAATNNGVLQIRNDKWQMLTTKNGLPSDRVNVVAAAPGNVLWVGTTAGVARLDHDRAEPFLTPPCDAGALSVDTDRNLWVGCEGNGGLLQIRRPAVSLLSVAGKGTNPIVNSIVEDRSGVIWIASARGLIRWSNGTAKTYSEKDGLPSSNIYAVSLANDGGLWIGTEDGFARMKAGSITAFRTDVPGPENPVNSIFEDRAGTLWVGAAYGLFRQRRDQKQLERIKNVDGTIWSIREDRDSNIWVSTNQRGLFRLSGDTQFQFTTANGLTSNTVRDTLQTDDGDIWVAALTGLSRIRNNEASAISHGQDFPKENLQGIATDSYGHLWIRTVRNVVALDISKANQAIEHGVDAPYDRLFGADDGFGDELSGVSAENSVLRHSSGQMWFATVSGIGRIDPIVLRTKAPLLKPQITSLRSDAGEHELSPLTALQPGDLRFQITYTAPLMNGNKTPDFRYQLVGFDKSWQEGTKDRTAVYTALAPGTYHFKISARRPFEPWIETSEPIEIRILPRFYQTWWWYTFLVAAFILSIFLAYQLRLRALQRQFAILMSERLRERSRLARELHDTLSQGMVGIHLQIEAAQVLLDVDPKLVRKHLENVGRLALEASVETRRSIAELRSGENEEPSLSRVVHKAVSDFNRSCIVELDAEIGEDLPRFSEGVIHEVSRILEEALANVRLHSGAEHAFLTAGQSASHFLLEVRDDGKGFKTEASKTLPDHFGITGMHERALRINGGLQLSSEPGKGTCVTLAVPLRTRWYGSMALSPMSKIPFVKNLFRTKPE